MSAILARLLSDLNIAAMERSPDGSFALISHAPVWLKELWPHIETQKAGLNLGDTFYFLDDFLGRHSAFWDTPTDQKKSSGVWVETTPEGEDRMLEALMLFIEGHPLLLIRVPHHQEIWPIYQQAREQRLEYEQLLDEINKREVLLHCIVHDLSNPLAGIKGSLNLLESEDMVDIEGNELLQIGLRQADKMQKLIKSILSTFANEVKPLVPTLIGADIAPDVKKCAHEVVNSLTATAALRDVILEIETEESELPLKAVGETERLERVLYNLLANAIRHSNEGHKITVQVVEDGNFIQTSVEDEGSGVPEELVEGLFDRFSQGANHSGQIGLGLYFCKITVEGWGGTIGYDQGNAGGARFWFKLPKPVVHGKPPHEEIQHS